ncbi:MAG: hypothetical protein ACI80I_003396, partial [Akkermansiaceae bacterium]
RDIRGKGFTLIAATAGKRNCVPWQVNGGRVVKGDRRPIAPGSVTN